MLLGQLATNAGWTGRGIGTRLVKHALQRCVAAAGLAGGRALVIDAVVGEAAAFWRRRVFLPSRDDPLILSRSMASMAFLAAAIGKLDQHVAGRHPHR